MTRVGREQGNGEREVESRGEGRTEEDTRRRVIEL